MAARNDGGGDAGEERRDILCPRELLPCFVRRTGLSRLSGEDLLGGRKNIASWKLPSSGRRGTSRVGGGGPSLWEAAPRRRPLPATATTTTATCSIIAGHTVQVTLFPVPALPHPA